MLAFRHNNKGKGIYMKNIVAGTKVILAAVILAGIGAASSSLADGVEDLVFKVNLPGNSLTEFLNGTQIGSWSYYGYVDPPLDTQLWGDSIADGNVSLARNTEILFNVGLTLFDGHYFLWESAPEDRPPGDTLLSTGATADFTETGATVKDGASQIAVNITVEQQSSVPDGTSTAFLLSLAGGCLAAAQRRFWHSSR
jgi:hypothetical protein